MKKKSPIDPNEPRLTTAQVVKQKCAAGLIRATKPGKVWQIPESAIVEYLTERSN